MPKEVFYDRPATESATQAGAAYFTPTDGLHLRVGWDDYYPRVMVGVEHNDHEDRVDDGMFLNLDRQQVNDLIKVLRRARDRVFGADE